MKAHKIIKKEIDIEIKGITLLPVKKAKKLPESIRACGEWWWLRSHGIGSCVAVVDDNGSVYDAGYFVNCFSGAVRPALKITNIKFDGLYENEIEVFGINWTYIGNNLWLAEEPIFYSEFDLELTDYEKSEIKKKLEDWLKEQMGK